MTEAQDTYEMRLVGEADWIAATAVCELCRLDLEAIAELVGLGLVAPRGHGPQDWLLPAAELPRLALAGRLIHDLGVNVSGAVLAIELLEAQRELESRLRRLERAFSLRPNNVLLAYQLATVARAATAQGETVRLRLYAPARPAAPRRRARSTSTTPGRTTSRSRLTMKMGSRPPSKSSYPLLICHNSRWGESAANTSMRSGTSARTCCVTSTTRRIW